MPVLYNMIYSLLAITTFVFTCINFSYAQHTSEVNAEIFFLDLGIVIEPARGNEKYSRLVKAPSKEVKITVKKVESGSIYMAASSEMLESLKRIQIRIDNLEETFRKKIDIIQNENIELKNIISEYTKPPLRKPERPEVLDKTKGNYSNEHLADIDIQNQLTAPEMPPLLPAVVKNIEFNQSAYMSGVFAYQRENCKEALRHFTSLDLAGASKRTGENVLYWMADCFRTEEDYDSALILLDKLLIIENPGRAEDALIQKGLIYREQGKEELAMIMFNDLVDEYPESDYVRLVTMEINKAEAYQ